MNSAIKNLSISNLPVVLAAAFALIAGEATAQEGPPSVIAKTSDLSSALPPGEWSRIETAVDKSLQWLAAQQHPSLTAPNLWPLVHRERTGNPGLR